jgi:hypothetical protein
MSILASVSVNSSEHWRRWGRAQELPTLVLDATWYRPYSQMMRWIAPGMAMWLAGCSFVFASGPPPHHEALPGVTCTESQVAPVLDTIFAVLGGANVVFAASVDDHPWSSSSNGAPPFARSTAIPVYTALTLLAASGAYYGFKNTGECHEAKAQAMIREQDGSFDQPQRWRPPVAVAEASPQGTRSPYTPPLAPFPYEPLATQSPYKPPGPSPYEPPVSQSPYTSPPASSPYEPLATQSPYAPLLGPSPHGPPVRQSSHEPPVTQSPYEPPPAPPSSVPPPYPYGPAQSSPSTAAPSLPHR